MYREVISSVHHMQRERCVRKKSTPPVKTAGGSLILFCRPRRAVFDVNDTRNAWSSVKPERNFLSLFFFSPPFPLFLDSRQTGKAAIKNAARGNVERGIGYFAQVQECIFHITAFCRESITSYPLVDSRAASSRGDVLISSREKRMQEK